MRRLPKEGSIRNVVTGQSDGYTGRIPFHRLGITCAFESMLSGSFLLVTSAFERDVVGIDSEPFRLPLPADGGRHWTPDYCIERASGVVEFVEVKPIEVVHPERAKHPSRGRIRDPEKVAMRFHAMRQAAHDEGYHFRLVTEDEIRVEPRLGNAALLLRYANPNFPMSWLLLARRYLAVHAIEDVAGLQEHFSPAIDVFPVALHLAWRGEIEFDPTRRFTRASRFVRVGDRNIYPAHKI